MAVSARELPTSLFLILHDYNSSAHELCGSLLRSLKEDPLPGARVGCRATCVNALNERPPLCGASPRYWYTQPVGVHVTDGEGSAEQYAETGAAVHGIDQLIDQVAELVGRENVFLGGVGQGCGIAALAVLLLRQPIGGLLGFNGWMPFSMDLEAAVFHDKEPMRDPTDLTDSSDESAVISDDDSDRTIRPQSAPRLRAAANFLRCKMQPPGRHDLPLNSETPVLLVHRVDDAPVRLHNGRHLERFMSLLGFATELKMVCDDSDEAFSGAVLDLFLGAFVEKGWGSEELREAFATYLELPRDS